MQRIVMASERGNAVLLDGGTWLYLDDASFEKVVSWLDNGWRDM